MRKLTQTSTFKRVLAAVCTAGLCVTLAACGSGDSGSSSKKSGDDSSQSSDSSALKNMKKIAGITATGTLGEKPKVSFKAPKTVDNNSYAVLQEGNGATIADGDRLCSQGIAISVKDGTELASSWEKNTPDCSLVLEKGTVSDAYYELLKGRKLNTTIAYGVNDSNSSGTSYIIGYKGSSKLVSQALIKGKGKEVTNNNTVKVKYTGWLLDGTQFDSSWDKNTTLEADTYSGGNHQVIEGWQQAMVGQTVGSQVLMVIPPNLGYGDTAQGSIPANSTLIFVVDILAAY